MTILPTQAHSGEFAWNIILDEHICLLDEFVNNLETFGFLEVDRDRTFVTVSSQEVSRLWRQVGGRCIFYKRCCRRMPSSCENKTGFKLSIVIGYIEQ